MSQYVNLYLDDLKDQINFFILGSIYLCIISPHNLQSLLLEIKTHLQPLLTLIAHPNTELWLFYKHLSSFAIMDGRKIANVLSLPLLRLEETFEVYRIYNLPILLCKTNIQDKLTSLPNLTAR